MSSSKYTHVFMDTLVIESEFSYSLFLFASFPVLRSVHIFLNVKTIFISTMDFALAICVHIRIRTMDLQRMCIFSGFSMCSWSLALFLFIRFLFIHTMPCYSIPFNFLTISSQPTQYTLTHTLFFFYSVVCIFGSVAFYKFSFVSLSPIFRGSFCILYPSIYLI